MGRKSLASERIGQMRVNTYGSLMEVVEYKNASNVTVKFLYQGNLVNIQWNRFLDGQVKNVYDKSVLGVGYIGEGKYKPSVNSKDTIYYITWTGMLDRCYNAKCQEKQPAYKGCTVTEEWHNFQEFSKWMDENYYQIEGKTTHLDKDILIKGNKVYSPDTCVFVPENINSLFTKNDINRGELPIGVDKSGSNYRARCTNGNNKRIHIGNFKTKEEAFVAYKRHKEKLIKYIAYEYKNKIPDKLYEALMNYKVEIND